MSSPTENTVNDLMASFLRDEGIAVTTQPSVRVPRGRRQPDFEARNGGIFYGEGEWIGSYIVGYNQAIQFGDVPGSSGYFLIGYPDDLRRGITQRRLGTVSPEVLLTGHTYRGMFKVKGEPPSLFRGPLEGVPIWLDRALNREPRREEPREFVDLMRDIVGGLTEFLPAAGDYPSLFDHIIASMPKGRGASETARGAAAYLLLNQVVFHRILRDRGYHPIEVDKLQRPGDLKQLYFDEVLKDDYQAIFDFDVASAFPNRSLQFIKDMVRIVEDLQPEAFTRDLLGNIFHSLIPLEVRKPVAAYYTNPMAARLLARLAIHDPEDLVADFAVGSGTLLMAAYDEKASLLRDDFGEAEHRRFIERDLTGVDIMPFAAHLAVVQLALRNPSFLTDQVRVAVDDSTRLRPGAEISPLEKVMPRGQTKVTYFEPEQKERVKVKEGAISPAGKGRGFMLKEVDVVIMNPPFTRKQHIKKDFRDMLMSRFEDYGGYANREQNLFGYFIFLADRFLAENGRMAMVLPATVLRQKSSQGVRRLISGKYWIEFIIWSGFRLAFSESTAFREILMIARKRDSSEGDPPCVLARLEVMPSEKNVDSIANLLREVSRTGTVTEPLQERASSAGIRLSIIEQDAFGREENWQQLLPGEQLGGFALPSSPFLKPLREVAPKVIQGLRFHRSSDKLSTRNSLLTRPREVSVKMNWRVEEEDGETVTARSNSTGEVVTVPRNALLATTRSPSGMDTIELSMAYDYLVVDRFQGDDTFWDDPDPKGIIERRLQHIKSREAYLIVAGRNNVNIGSSGTHFLAFVAPRLVAPTWSFWSVQMDSLQDARLLALWWNSTFHLPQLIGARAEVGGVWMGWPKSDLLRMKVLHPFLLPEESKREMMKVYRKWKEAPFPSLLEQLKTRFEGRIAIDAVIARVMDLSWDDLDMPGLYEMLADKIETLKAIVTRV